MSEEYFTRVQSELARRTRDGAHLAVPPRYLGRAARRTAAAGLLSLALAASLASEFPASANGMGALAPAVASLQGQA